MTSDPSDPEREHERVQLRQLAPLAVLLGVLACVGAFLLFNNYGQDSGKPPDSTEHIRPEPVKLPPPPPGCRQLSYQPDYFSFEYADIPKPGFYEVGERVDPASLHHAVAHGNAVIKYHAQLDAAALQEIRRITSSQPRIITSSGGTRLPAAFAAVHPTAQLICQQADGPQLEALRSFLEAGLSFR